MYGWYIIIVNVMEINIKMMGVGGGGGPPPHMCPYGPMGPRRRRGGIASTCRFGEKNHEKKEVERGVILCRGFAVAVWGVPFSNSYE